MKTIKKELILEGLSCAHCSSKIEECINNLDGIDKAQVNFVEKKLTIDIDTQKDVKEILEESIEQVKRIEPDIIIKEKIVSTATKKILLLMGLCCEPCALKIEKGIRELEGVRHAAIDFEKGLLEIEIINKERIKPICDESINIARSIVSGIKVKEEKKEKEALSPSHFIPSLIGSVFFFFVLITKLPFIPITLPFIAEISLYVISYLLIGGDILLKAFKNLTRGRIFDENFLMTIATIGAFAIQEFPEAVAVMLFYKIGEFFQAMAVNNSRKSIKALLDIRPDYAHLKKGDELKMVSPYDVAIGDHIIIKPGEKVPLDGKILEGSSMLDTSAITGESVHRGVKPGDTILSGFINKNGVLTVEVEKAFGESTVSKILELVENATNKKSKTESFISKFAGIYTPAVVLIALIIAFIPPLFISGALFSDWIYRALIFLVVSCPCALVVSIPLGFFGGIGASSKNGILVKGSNYLDALNKVDTIVFDKTGTITKGSFTVTEISPVNGMQKDELLRLAAYAEFYSNHPIALSIGNHYSTEIDKSKIKEYDEISGLGIKAVIESQTVFLGNDKLMTQEQISMEKVSAPGTIIYVAVDGTYAGYIVISDEIKDDTKTALKTLKTMGIQNLIMLTGDNKAIADSIANEVGIDRVYAELLPDQKVSMLEKIEAEKATQSKMMFIGDGINDSPVIARADIGVAMGALGSDAAIEVADIVLMTDEISKVPIGLKIAKKTRTIVNQNIIFALAIKAAILLLGAAGFATMWAAVFADVGVALLAILNALRIIRKVK